MKTYFLIIIIIILILIWISNKNENFSNNSTENNTNIFFLKQLPNIYYTKRFYQDLFVPPPSQKSSLADITFNSYLNSNTIDNKITCSSITNQGRCWDNNNCQWVHKIDGNSYCKLGPKLFL